MSKRFDKPELDAVRFFAFCAVFCDHVDTGSAWWTQFRDMGAFGMPLFFLLSAYLIVTLLLREQRDTGTIGLRYFFIRRVLRIWPLYFALLAFAAVFGHFYRPVSLSHAAILSMAFSLGNVWVAQHGWFSVKWLAPLWSLSVEEQFYLGIPSLVRVVRRPLLIGCFAAFIAISYPTIVWLGQGNAIPIVQVWTNSFVQFQYFAAGGLLALWNLDHTVSLKAPARLALVAGGLASWYVAANVCHLSAMSPVPTVLLVSGYAVILLGTLALFVAALDVPLHIPKQIRYLGRITYGLYLFHNLFLWSVLHSPMQSRMPASLAIRVALAGAATLVTAAASYQFFERPFLRLKYRFEIIHSRPA